MKKRVWDVPVRVFHWSLVACFATLWFTRAAEESDLHAAAGYALLALLAFRIAWAFTGTIPARLSSFLHSPRAAWVYLLALRRGKAPHYTSHNPAGSWAIYFLVLLALLAAGSGLLVLAAEKNAGPLGGHVGPALANTAHLVHEVSAWAMLVMAGAHVLGAVASSFLHHENYIAAMIHGAKAHLPENFTPVASRGAVALALLLVAGAFFALPVADSGRLQAYAGARAAAKGTPPVESAWRRECGSCHLAYAPSLLPMRSWERMLAEQEKHFGEDLALGAKDQASLLAFAKAASPANAWVSLSIAAEIAPGEAPQRITQTPFWIREHDRLSLADFKPPRSTGRHQCEACHIDAEAGTFRFRMIHIPNS